MAGKSLKFSVVCNFFIALVLEGLQRLSGLFVLELLQSTNVNHQTASVPFIFSWVVSNIIASFSGMVTHKKKSEYVILSGVLLSAAGAALCVLATNITTLTVFWGLIFGSGHGLASPHLSKRLENTDSTKLSFILQMTSSLGVLILPFALSVFISHYEVQGCCLILCGLILNYLPLALGAAYSIKIYTPNIKWRVRKKSKQYSVSKQEGKTVSLESFNSSLEPDLILNMCLNSEFQDEIIGNKSEFPTEEVLKHVNFPVGRKRSETRGNDLEGFNNRIFEKNKTHSQVFIEIANYEKGRDVFECSFNNQDVVHDGMESTIFKANDVLNCNIINSIKLLEKNSLNSDKESELNLKNEILHKLSECEINQTLGENKESLKSLNDCTRNSVDFPHTYVVTANTTMHNLDLNKDGNAHQNNERYEKDINISSSTEMTENPHYNSTKEFQTIKSAENQQLGIEHSISLPLDIKVHVEECIFITGKDDTWEDISSSKYITIRKNSNTNNSNSQFLDTQKSTDFSNQKFPKTFSKCSELHKPKLSSIYSISENSEPIDNDDISEEDKYVGNSNNVKSKGIFTFFKWIFSSRVCLFILLIKMIFEINLVTLLIVCADLGNDIDNQTSDFKWIFVAFGAGGLIGKFCCCKISKTIPEKCHAIGVVLFLLNGLATNGVLYSNNLNWLAGFYCILGALEGGITYIIPNFILQYTEKEVHSTMSSVKRFLSGVAVVCIPYGIGLFRDEMGEYEFLLQILSCSSLLCAFLAYFLPIRTASNKRINQLFRSKTGTT